MSSASSAATYTSVYTDSEPGRVLWGADEEISDRRIPRVIVLGYDGLAMQPVAPPSPDYIPGPEDPQTPLVSQMSRMSREAYDVIAEHRIQTRSPGYITESDPEEDPEEYEDDETEDGPVDYPMDEGDDGDDDDSDSSVDDADDKDEDDDDEEEEEEEHLAPADSAVVIPADEPVSPPKGTKPVIPPPSTDITIGARIIVRPQGSISLPPEAEVERLLAMTTLSPSPLISLSPPSAGERLARCMALPAHSSPPPVPSPLLPSYGCPTQIQTHRIASTQAFIDAITAILPSPPLPPLPPSLYIPPPADHRDDIPESEQPPRKRLCLSTLGSRLNRGEFLLRRPIMRVTELAELHEHDIEDLYSLLEDAQDSRALSIQHINRYNETRFRMAQSEIAALRETNRRHQEQMVETLRVMRDMRQEMGDMQTELLALRGQRRARQPAPDARIPDHQDALGDADSHV
ncbi:hypothetical protein Tco_0824144 [Tanacetum coccineum]|uniref:Uncharacterized protein n=1 Tax=Tanacetum coccineum TaxID=301880 RepID=A0ABQ5AJW7_9ASTR